MLPFTLTLTGLSGISYNFQLHHLGTTPYPISAIYAVGKIMINERGDKRFDTLYIGKTCDIQSRFTSHHKDAEFRKNQANCIGIMQVEKEVERDLIERDLIQKYNPVCNDQLTH